MIILVKHFETSVIMEPKIRIQAEYSWALIELCFLQKLMYLKAPA